VPVGRVTPCAPVFADGHHRTSGVQRTDPPYKTTKTIIDSEKAESKPHSTNATPLRVVSSPRSAARGEGQGGVTHKNTKHD